MDTILTADGRCIVLDIEYEGSRYHVVNVYFPNSDEERNSSIIALYPLLSSQYPIILGGDLNIAVSPIIDRYPPRKIKDANSTDLENLISTFDLKDVCRKIFPSRPFFFPLEEGILKVELIIFY